MFNRSIRWRLVLWLSFLLVGILSGFGITAYQLHRANRFSQIDAELVRRVAALSRDTRMMPGLPPGRGRFGPDEFDDHENGAWSARRKGPRPEPWPGSATNSRGWGPGDAGGPKREVGEPGGKRPMPQTGSGVVTNRGNLGPQEGASSLDEELEYFLGSPPPEDFLHHPMSPPWFGDAGPEFRKIQLSISSSALFDGADPEGFYYFIWARSGKVLKQSTNAPSDTPFPNPSKTDTLIRIRTRGDRREAFQSTEIGECVLAGRSIVADLAAVRRFGWLLVLAGGGVLVLGVGGGWLLATRAIRPVEDISATARRISAGNLAERINVAETESELGRLAGVLNSMFARLEAAFEQQKQFTADAAHELRTPLAVLISEAQTTLHRARSPEEYREAMEMCLETAQQMRRLTQSLLELARLDASGGMLERSELDLAVLASAGMDFIRTLAQNRNIRILGDLSCSPMLGDADRLSQVLTNLLNNAIQYGREGGEVRVSTRLEEGKAILSVADNGHGIAPEDLPHIFDRFYRGDKARGRANGQTGLGLAICRAIVEAHGGTIEAVSRAGQGTTVSVRFPVEAIRHQSEVQARPV